MRVEITEAGIAHAGVILKLHNVCFDTPWEPKAINEILSMPRVGALIISKDDQPEGFALLRVAVDEAEIISIGISPNARRAGQAGRLLQSLITNAGRQGALKIFLEVNENNLAARRLYEKLGFEAVGRRKGYYISVNEKTDALIYSLEITAK